MPIKGIFEQSQNDDFLNELIHKLEQFERRSQKIDALETQMTQLLKREQHYSAQMLKLESHFTLLQTHINKHFKKLYETKGKTTPNTKLEQEYSLLASQMEEYLNELVSLKNDIQQMKMDQEETTTKQPIIFNEYKIEHVTIDNYEVNNNIAQLGIKDLGGQLNIGATYGKVPPEIMKEMSEKAEALKDTKEELSQQKDQGLNELSEDPEENEEESTEESDWESIDIL
ncbi:hypothetical protein [Neobacillus sp. D3-1R]|uniref:hypothetical protein n=1 Tax=Neobacillus sp. D3-1R TaxID=3445778 RepID=UPI003FA14104